MLKSSKPLGRVVPAVLMSAVAVLSLAACANREQASTVTPTTPAPATNVATPTAAKPTTTAANQPAGPVCTAEDVKVTGGVGEQPTVTIPDTCKPGPTMLSKDLVAGNGPAAKVGDPIQVYYHLITWSDKVNKDGSWKRPPLQPFPVQSVGKGLIPAWNEGLVGIKQGTRRLLIAPPDKGYGPEGDRGIKGNETLVFVIDAVKVGA